MIFRAQLDSGCLPSYYIAHNILLHFRDSDKMAFLCHTLQGLFLLIPLMHTVLSSWDNLPLESS